MSHVWAVRENRDLNMRRKARSKHLTNVHVTRLGVSTGALQNKVLKLGSSILAVQSNLMLQ